MSVRFRIRTPAGQELSFASPEMFKDFVRSGDLSPDDLVYDADYGSWAPARTHPLVLEIEYQKDETGAARATEARAADAESQEASAAEPDTPDEKAPEESKDLSAEDAFGLTLAEAQATQPEQELESQGAQQRQPAEELAAAAAAERDAASGEPAVEAPTEQADDPAAEAGATGGGSGGLGLDLTPAENRSAEDEQRAFLEEMEAERRDELEFQAPDKSMEGFHMESGSVLSEMVRSEPTPHAPREATPSEPREPRRSEPRRSEPRRSKPRRGEPRGKEPAPRPGKTVADRAKAKKSGGGRRFLSWILLLVVLAGAGYAGLQFLGQTQEVVIDPEPDPPDAATPAPEPEPPPRVPVIANTEEAVRERAQERFLTSTQTQLRDLRSIPEAWPFGEYLSRPAEHAEVLAVWQEYLSTIRAVRAGDTSRYRVAYESALDDAVVEGVERADRLEAALTDFSAEQALRDAHYDRVEALATAAISGHQALLEADGLILYDGSGATGAQSGIGLGTSGRDAGSQLRLDQVVELLESALAADGLGPGDGASVREWVWDGFLDVVAN